MEESPCSVCGKLLPSKAALKSHETLHRNQDKYVCSYCPKAFCTKTRKTIHERVHTGEKPYQVFTINTIQNNKTFLNPSIFSAMSVATGSGRSSSWWRTLGCTRGRQRTSAPGACRGSSFWPAGTTTSALLSRVTNSCYGEILNIYANVIVAFVIVTF